MEQEILKDWQKKVCQFITASNQLNNFYLSGGTALAGFYLHHRISDDLDFFSFKDIDSIFIHKVAEDLKTVVGSEDMRFSRLYDRYQFFYMVGDEEYKIEFARYPFKQLKEVGIFDTLKVDSEFDIAVNKLLTIVDRFDPKDFVDLYFLLPKYNLEQLMAGVENKFGTKLSPLTVGSSFSRAKDIAALPKMVRNLSVDEVKSFFSAEAQKLSPKVLD